MLCFRHITYVRLLSGNNGPHMHVFVLGIQYITAAPYTFLSLQRLCFIHFINHFVHLVIILDFLFFQFVHLLFSYVLNLLLISLLLL